MGRATREEWTARVEQLKESGLSVARFAAEIGVNAKTLAWWRAELASGARETRRALAKRKAGASADIAPIRFVEVTPRSETGAVEIVLSSGVTIRARPGFDSSTLARVLDIVESRRR
jgi:hypothetical protein